MVEIILTQYALAGMEDPCDDLDLNASPQVYDVCLRDSADEALKKAQKAAESDLGDVGEPLQWFCGPWMPGDPAGGRPYREAHLRDVSSEPWAMVVQQKVVAS